LLVANSIIVDLKVMKLIIKFSKFNKFNKSKLLLNKIKTISPLRPIETYVYLISI
jgi:hypothetical protein